MFSIIHVLDIFKALYLEVYNHNILSSIIWPKLYIGKFFSCVHFSYINRVGGWTRFGSINKLFRFVGCQQRYSIIIRNTSGR